MRVLITGASGGIGAACVQRFLDEGHEVVGFDLLPAAIEHERYRHLIVDVREPDSFPDDLEPQVIVNVAGTQDSATFTITWGSRSSGNESGSRTSTIRWR